jgi:hypothetical protein
MNFYPSVFELKVVASDDKSITFTLLNNELSQILKAGMKCTVEFPENSNRPVRIDSISESDGIRRLECSFAHRDRAGIPAQLAKKG